MKTRYANVYVATRYTPSQVARVVDRYLPYNYRITGVTADGHIRIAGEDDHGWTLDDYVIPRLASGMYACREVGACNYCGKLNDEPFYVPEYCSRYCYTHDQ